MVQETRMISTRIPLVFADFNGRPRQQYALCYNEHTGSLVSDEGRNIARIDYDNLGNPIRIQFTNGNVTKYVYSAAVVQMEPINPGIAIYGSNDNQPRTKLTINQLKKNVKSASK